MSRITRSRCRCGRARKKAHEEAIEWGDPLSELCLTYDEQAKLVRMPIPKFVKIWNDLKGYPTIQTVCKTFKKKEDEIIARVKRHKELGHILITRAVSEAQVSQ